MNIWALEGHKVTVTERTINNGHKHNSEQVKELCQIGTEYTVDYTIVHGFHTEVYLKEFPGVCFNSVNFEDVSEQSEEQDRMHEMWSDYNDDEEEN